MYNIMIVDDREIFRREFKSLPFFKNNNDFAVSSEAQNGAEALELLREADIDILITDIRMPIMDGLALLRAVKEENLCPIVVLLSEYAEFSFAREGLILGAFDYIVKPVEEKALESILNRCAEFLKNSAGNNRVVMNEVRLLPVLMMNNDELLHDASYALAEKVAAENENNIMAVYETLDYALKYARAEIDSQMPYLSRYCRFDKLFAFTPSDVHEGGIAEGFRTKTDIITVEINKFSIGAKSSLVKSICNTVLKDVENDVSLSALADLHYVNKAYLSHIFKQDMGVSFTDFVTLVKIERAKVLLADTDEKIYEIGEKLGYGDSEYFSKIFKQFTGVSPSEYRRANS